MVRSPGQQQQQQQPRCSAETALVRRPGAQAWPLGHAAGVRAAGWARPPAKAGEAPHPQLLNLSRADIEGMLSRADIEGTYAVEGLTKGACAPCHLAAQGEAAAEASNS
jgi:hypothetical protein